MNRRCSRQPKSYISKDAARWELQFGVLEKVCSGRRRVRPRILCSKYWKMVQETDKLQKPKLLSPQSSRAALELSIGVLSVVPKSVERSKIPSGDSWFFQNFILLIQNMRYIYQKNANLMDNSIMRSLKVGQGQSRSNGVKYGQIWSE